MNNVLAYENRRIDGLALRGAKAVGNVELDQTLFDETTSGEACTGTQKLAQRWAMEFLTELGSMDFLLDRGCNFVTLAKSGALQSEADVVAVFNIANLTIIRNLRNEETNDMHDDERLANAELLTIVVAPGTIALSVQVNSLAGDARTVILPIDILPTPLV